MSAASATRAVSLALQGGGAHGALTWGVLDTLLADRTLSIRAISGSSAGAMNAVLLASGWQEGGAEGARAALRRFWEEIGATRAFASSPGSAQLLRGWTHLAHYFSSAQLNPFDLNPLRDILGRIVDFKRLQRSTEISLHIGATHVSTATPRIFGNTELTREVLLASACLPSLHRTIEIYGDAYWDGGLTANPPLLPLVRGGEDDLILVLLEPTRSTVALARADAIAERVAEIAFASPLGAELRMLAWAQREARRAWPGWGRLERRLRRLRLHLIEAPEFLGQFEPQSRANVAPAFIEALFRAGQERAREWLRTARPAVGIRATFEAGDRVHARP